MDANRLAVDLNPNLAKVNLQLMAWRCLEANRRPRLRLKLTPPRDYRPFDRAQAHFNRLLTRQILTHYIGIATMAPKPLRQPSFQPIQRLRPPWRSVADPTLAAK